MGLFAVSHELCRKARMVWRTMIRVSGIDQWHVNMQDILNDFTVSSIESNCRSSISSAGICKGFQFDMYASAQDI